MHNAGYVRLVLGSVSPLTAALGAFGSSVAGLVGQIRGRASPTGVGWADRLFSAAGMPYVGVIMSKEDM